MDSNLFMRIEIIWVCPQSFIRPLTQHLLGLVPAVFLGTILDAVDITEFIVRKKTHV